MFVNKRIFHTMNFITGEKFTKICDRVFFHYKDVDVSELKSHETIISLMEQIIGQHQIMTVVLDYLLLRYKNAFRFAYNFA
jgi:hypothetical protein